MSYQHVENLLIRYRGKAVDIKTISGGVYEGIVSDVTNDYVALRFTTLPVVTTSYLCCCTRSNQCCHHALINISDIEVIHKHIFCKNFVVSVASHS